MSKDLQKTNPKVPAKNTKGKLDLSEINLDALTAGLSELSIPRLFYQLVVFVLDGSGSMTYSGNSGKSKGEEIDKAVKETLERLLISKNKNSFDISVWAYANEIVQISSVKSLSTFDVYDDLNPCAYIDKYDGTNLKSVLDEVQIECTDYLNKNQGKNSQVLIIIISDGAIDAYHTALEKCSELKLSPKINIASVFFESKIWQEDYNVKDEIQLKLDMEKLASNSSLFYSTLNPEEIRNHMIKSISTVSKID